MPAQLDGMTSERAQRIFLRCLVLALVLVVSGGAARAADDVATARARFASGQQHFDLGEFAAALEDFKEAYRLRADPALLFNIGQCQFKLHDDEAALHSYRTYLRKASDAPNRTFVEARIAELTRRMAPAPSAPSVAPPQPTMPPPTPVPPPAIEAHGSAPPPVESAHGRWWWWAGAAMVVAGGVAAVLIARRDPTHIPPSDLGSRRAFP
jgi:tetratricopeptide (TPR) repeat protein